MPWVESGGNRTSWVTAQQAQQATAQQAEQAELLLFFSGPKWSQSVIFSSQNLRLSFIEDDQWHFPWSSVHGHWKSDLSDPGIVVQFTCTCTPSIEGTVFLLLFRHTLLFLTPKIAKISIQTLSLVIHLLCNNDSHYWAWGTCDLTNYGYFRFWSILVVKGWRLRKKKEK